MERLIKDRVLQDLDFSDFTACVDCIKGKLTAKVRKSKTDRCTGLLELIHTNICGPFVPPAMGELICEKSESLDAFKIFKTKDELQKGKKIKAVNSNRGGEYYGRYDENGRNPGPFVRYLQECGIDARYTMPSTPQHNGIAERRNRTLLDMVRCYTIGSRGSREERIFVPVPVASAPIDDPVIEQIPVETHDEPQNQEQGEDHDVGDDEVMVRRSQRARRPANPDYYLVYFQEHELDVQDNSEPVSYQEAMHSPKSVLWMDVMKEELSFMSQNEFWELVQLPKDVKGEMAQDGIGNMGGMFSTFPN
ncbi:uncharacterized protein LOC133824186 [Humulus lupulus]|uniref:uncharacterized protein LOC133824186 n=1 Tax=Humulus lupulus TaxID=3486 RepID=UPI002B407D76|nr:uncharacterized protein LOC133824186 [Humulus lupulus]